MFKPLLAGRPAQAQPSRSTRRMNPCSTPSSKKSATSWARRRRAASSWIASVNAAAGFRRGFLSLFSSDMVLVLGLPLVANLTAPSWPASSPTSSAISGKGAGMRLGYIVTSINRWFVRVAYQRDAWDVGLENWSMAESSGWVLLVVWSVQIAVWFSRLVLKGLLFIGILVGGFLMRQKEYDADAYEIRVAGSDAFERTLRKLSRWRRRRSSWDANSRELDPDQNPAGQSSRSAAPLHERLPQPVVRRINDTLGLHRTGLFDSHPSPPTASGRPGAWVTPASSTMNAPLRHCSPA